MLPIDKLHAICERYDYIAAMLSAGEGDIVALGREYTELGPVVESIREWERLRTALVEAEALYVDPELAVLAVDEIESINASLPEVEARVKRALLPRDASDARPAILEIRPGTGGEEAALFASDLLRMYSRHAERQGWRVDMLELSHSDLGGVREAVMRISGDSVFARLKYESGVHRVQRVPETESGGRIHTSAATVAVLPVVEDVAITIDPNDLRIDTMRASGAGGQHVNTTDSAVRITHLPTGIVVTSSEKSQHQNRANAMAVLKARLIDREQREATEGRAAARKAQLGSGDRSERIRTYNFPQGRLTDHRIGLTLYRLAEILAGDLDEVIDTLATEDEAARLAEMGL